MNENNKNLINPFPKYTSGSDPDLYMNIFNFLKNGLINNKRCWPEYIDNIKDKLIKNNKKIEFYKKIGPIGKGYGKTKLKDSNSISKFEVSKDELYNNRIVNDPILKEKIVKKYRIPKSKEIVNILKDSHDNKNHCGIAGTKFIIDSQNIYWIDMMNDIKKYIKNCLTCNKVKKFEKKDKIPCKTILSKGPRDRYVIDLWHLPAELNSKFSNYRYILDVIDHFSKYTQSYLLNSKESLEIFPKIKNFIQTYGVPKYLISDNGREFKNRILKDYCLENNILFVYF